MSSSCLDNESRTSPFEELPRMKQSRPTKSGSRKRRPIASRMAMDEYSSLIYIQYMQLADECFYDIYYVLQLDQNKRL